MEKYFFNLKLTHNSKNSLKCYSNDHDVKTSQLCFNRIIYLRIAIKTGKKCIIIMIVGIKRASSPIYATQLEVETVLSAAFSC